MVLYIFLSINVLMYLMYQLSVSILVSNNLSRYGIRKIQHVNTVYLC